MNKIEYIAKKHELFCLIKEFGDIYGENIDFLREYAQDVVNLHKDYLVNEAIECFKDLIRQGKQLKRVHLKK